MATIVTIEVVIADVQDEEAVDRAIDRALAWFDIVERTCSRFLPESELMGISSRVGVPEPVSPLLAEAVSFALAVAAASDGAFDPTVGARMAAAGFDREHRSGEPVTYEHESGGHASFRDVAVDVGRSTITIHAPLVLDLGGLAKGLAIDLAAAELAAFRHFAIDAGGDLYASGHNVRGEPWTIGIRHPRQTDAIIETVAVADAALCTSGDYERRRPGGGAGHHLIDPRNGESAQGLASVTVRAPRAVVADALATAAFVLGPDEGLAFLEREGVEGLLITPDLSRRATLDF